MRANEKAFGVNLCYRLCQAQRTVCVSEKRNLRYSRHDHAYNKRKDEEEKKNNTLIRFSVNAPRTKEPYFVRSFVMHYRSIDIHRSPLCYVPDGRMKRGATSVLTSRESFLLTDKKLNRTRATLVYVGRYHVGRERWAFYLSLFTDDKMHLHFLH